MGDGHWLVRMEWRPAGWSVCLPLLIFSCTIKSTSSLLALAHPGGPGKRAVKWLCVCVCLYMANVQCSNILIYHGNVTAAGSSLPQTALPGSNCPSAASYSKNNQVQSVADASALGFPSHL